MRRIVLAATVALTASLGLVSASSATLPIIKVGHNQYFLGAVNGASQEAVIQVVCPGPVGVAGHPLAGQSVDANLLLPPLLSTLGYTGTASSIGVNLIYRLSSGTIGVAARLGTLRFYGVPLAIPTRLAVPCSGVGSVAFSPINGGPSARPSVVNVSFVNVAVTPGS